MAAVATRRPGAWFDELARAVASDVSRRRALSLLAGATAATVTGSLVRPRRAPGAVASAASDPGCTSIRTPYKPDCPKHVPKLNYRPSFNGCGPQNGVNVVPNNPLGIGNFRAACNGHDVCYGTCNSGKDTCDREFLTAMVASCAQKYPGNGLFDSVGRAYCLQYARIYYTAVSVGGAGAYETAQAEGCDCCGVDRYEVVFSSRGEGHFGAYDAFGQLEVRLVAGRTNGDPTTPPSAWAGVGAAVWTQVILVSNSPPCTYALPVGADVLNVMITDQGHDTIKLDWYAPNAANLTATIDCPPSGDYDPPPIPGQPALALIGVAPASFTLPAAGGTQSISGGVSGTGWSNNGTITVTPLSH